MQTVINASRRFSLPVAITIDPINAHWLRIIQIIRAFPYDTIESGAKRIARNGKYK